MRQLLMVIALCCAFSGARGAESDPTDLNRATSEFLASMEVLQKDVAQVTTAERTAKALDFWADASMKFFNALNIYGDKYPKVAGATQPPPELVWAMQALGEVRVKYASIPQTLGPLYKKFHEDPAVSKAFQHMLEVQKFGEDSATRRGF